MIALLLKLTWFLQGVGFGGQKTGLEQMSSSMKAPEPADKSSMLWSAVQIRMGKGGEF
jgi:hypothetical protein